MRTKTKSKANLDGSLKFTREEPDGLGDKGTQIEEINFPILIRRFEKARSVAKDLAELEAAKERWQNKSADSLTSKQMKRNAKRFSIRKDEKRSDCPKSLDKPQQAGSQGNLKLRRRKLQKRSRES